VRAARRKVGCLAAAGTRGKTMHDMALHTREAMSATSISRQSGSKAVLAPCFDRKPTGASAARGPRRSGVDHSQQQLQVHSDGCGTDCLWCQKLPVKPVTGTLTDGVDRGSRTCRFDDN